MSFKISIKYNFEQIYCVKGNIDNKINREDVMAKKEKLLCKWKKEAINKKFDEFCDIVRNPKFVCKKCGRVADKKKWLHKPITLD